MPLKQDFIRKLGQIKNPLTDGLLNFVLKEYYFRAFYACLNGRRRRWAGKQACFSLSFDCDFSEDVQAIPPVLEMLAQYSIKASFACIGKLIEQDPAIHRRIVEAGHEIMNHTYTHPPSEELNSTGNFHKLSLAEQYEEIEQCHRVCQALLDYEPVGFRIPHYGFQYTDTIYGLLKKLGYRYSSSLKAPRSPSFGLPYIAEAGILEFPMTTCPQHPINAFDTWHAFHVGKHSEADFYTLFCRIIDTGLQYKAYMNLYFDPRDVVEAKSAFTKILELLKNMQSDLYIVKYEDMVDWSWV